VCVCVFENTNGKGEEGKSRVERERVREEWGRVGKRKGGGEKGFYSTKIMNF
jgi:hypothetical protein